MLTAMCRTRGGVPEHLAELPDHGGRDAAAGRWPRAWPLAIEFEPSSFLALVAAVTAILVLRDDAGGRALDSVRGGPCIVVVRLSESRYGLLSVGRRSRSSRRRGCSAFSAKGSRTHDCRFLLVLSRCDLATRDHYHP